MNFRHWVQTYLASSPAVTRKDAGRLRRRALKVERLETRKLLAAAPYATLELVRGSTDSLASAAVIRLDTYEFSYKNTQETDIGVQLPPQLDALSATANHAENGSAVFAEVVKNKVFARAVLTQRDNNGDAVSAWVMTNLQVLNEQVFSDDGSTIEDLRFSFRQITEASSLSTASWDTLSGRTGGPVVPPEINLRPYAATSSFSELQLFERSADTSPTTVLTLNEFRFGIHNEFNESQALQGQGGSNSDLKFDSLMVSSFMTSASPALFKSLTSGSTYSRALVTQRGADGTVVGTWTLAVLGLIEQDIIGQDDALPELNLSFSFSVLGSQTSSADFRWDVLNNRPATTATATSVVNVSQSSNLSVAPVTVSASPPSLTLELTGGTARPVSLNLNSFSLGTHSNGSFGVNGYGVVIPSFEPLIVSSALTTDTPLLYEALVTAKFYASGTLVQRDPSGSPIAVWALDQILVSDATFSGFGDAANQQELTFRFASMTQATSNASASWSQVTNSNVGPAVPSNLALTPVPAKVSDLTLKLYSSVSANSAAFTIPLDDFVFGSSVPGLTGGTAAGATEFDQLIVSSQLQGISPSLFAALPTGRRFGKATLTKSTASAPLTIATLGNVYITDDLISGDTDTIPNQQLKLLYSQLTQSAGGLVTSWDILGDRADGPAPLPGLDLSSLPASSGSIVLELKELASDARPQVNINLDSLEYGFEKIPNGVGADTLKIRTLSGNATPVLFGALARQSRFEWGQVTQYDESGVIVSRLTLGNVLLTGSQTTGLSSGEIVDEYGLAYTTFRQQVGTASAAWNFVTNREEFGGAGLNLVSAARSSLATVEAPTNSLVLELNDGTNPAIVIPLNTFDYAYENQYPTGLPAISIYKPLTVNFDMTNSSPALFTAMARGKLFGNASIKKYEGDRLVAGWLLSNVVIKSDDTSSEGGQTTKSLTLDYTNLLNIAGTQTTLVSSSPSTTYGQSLTFTATVTSSGASVNTGSVSFSIGSTQLASVSLNASGQASFTTSSLNVTDSPYLIQATYVPSTTLLSSTASIDASISAATLTITPADNQSKVYGDGLPALNFTASGLVNNDPLTLVTGRLGTTANASSSVGNYPFTLGTLSAGSNYVLALASSAPQFAVTAASLTLLPDDNQSKRYGDDNPVLTYTASGLKNNDSNSVLSGSLATVATKSSSVGSYGFALGTLTAGANYNLALATNSPSFTVKEATLTIVPNSGQSMTYGGPVPALSYTASGLKNNDSTTIVVGELSTRATAASDVGRYAFGLGTLSAGNNYVLELAANPSTFEVKPATLTITPTANQSKVYGSDLPPLGYSVDGLKNNDPASIVTGQLGTTATVSSVVGDYSFTINTLSANTNYVVVLSPNSSQLKVTPAPLKITADDKTKTFGADNPTLTATIKGLVNNDTSSVVTGLVLSTTATKFSPPSATPYPILVSGATAANYQIEFAAGKLTISSVSVTAAGTKFTPIAGAPFQGTVATFASPDPSATVNSYTAQINWGDGSTSSGTILRSGNEFMVTGSRTYSTSGTYTVGVTIRHKLGITTPTEVSSTAVVTKQGFGQTQNSEYWRDQAGQNLINRFNESATSAQLGNWLASTFPRLYGAQAGTNNLSGKTNAQVAAYYASLFKRSSSSLEREVLATALNIYASTLDLGGVAGARAGFQVTLSGLGATSVNVGSRGSSFGVPNNTSLSVTSLLTFINSRTAGGVLYSGAASLRAGAQQVLSQVNAKGQIGIDESQVESTSFWSGGRGQGLIRSFNGSPTATQLSSWLAETMPNLFGATAGTRNLTGKTNAQVAQAFSVFEKSKRDRAYSQVFALALNVYATTQSLGGSSSQCNLKVTASGLGAAEFNVGVNGAVAGVVNGSTINVYAYLKGVDRLAVNGVLYNGNARLTELAERFTKDLNDSKR